MNLVILIGRIWFIKSISKLFVFLKLSMVSRLSSVDVFVIDVPYSIDLRNRGLFPYGLKSVGLVISERQGALKVLI